MGFKKFLCVVLCFGIILITAPKIFAGEIDILVDKLVDKGILTRAEGNEILKETREEVKKEIKSVKHPTLPKWVQKTKLKGDFRIRYEHKKRKGSQVASRGRIRYRLGIESKVIDKVKIGAGLATGSDANDSARSTNQDLQDIFSTMPINLDYAYAEYTPFDWLSGIVGKFKRKKYLWEPADLLWDTDINPEGFSIQAKHNLIDNVDGFVNTGMWILDEASGDTSDPYMIYIQGGLKAKKKDLGLDAKVAVTYYDFDNVINTTLDGALGDNTTFPGGSLLAYKFNPIAVGAEVGLADPFGLPIERVATFGEFVHNPDPDDENNGWLMGIKFGHKKTYGKNKWQLKYMYARLQKDAFLDVFPDADRYSGGTDIVSHEGILQYGLNKNIMFELDGYHSNRVNAASRPENVVQVSTSFKF